VNPILRSNIILCLLAGFVIAWTYTEVVEEKGREHFIRDALAWQKEVQTFMNNHQHIDERDAAMEDRLDLIEHWIKQQTEENHNE
jgi:hypothetical protein